MSQWRTFRGELLHYHQMDDKHLANILHLINHYKHPKNKDLLKEIKKRKLTKKFLKQAPYSFKDKKTGKIMIWDYYLDRPVECFPEIKLLKT